MYGRIDVLDVLDVRNPRRSKLILSVTPATVSLHALQQYRSEDV